MAEYSPMMQHYIATKNEYKDCILFYRLGDFYEMFFDDAVVASKELELTLTGKDCGQKERAPMCGVPFHAAETYINRLVSAGYKVAICEQMEDPKQAKGIVKREVIKVVTPGTNINTLGLDETRNNYIMSIEYLGDNLGVSIADYSTGDFFVTELAGGSELIDEINKFVPSEIIVNEYFAMSGINLDTVNTWYLMLEDFTYEQVQNAIVKFFKQKNKYMPNLPNIVENIEVPDYTIKKIPPNTVIIQFEDEAYGNFPFRFLNSQDAKEYSKKFQECNYDKESIKILHEEHVRKRNAGVLTYRGEAKARLEQKLQNQNNKGSRRYDKQSSFS